MECSKENPNNCNCNKCVIEMIKDQSDQDKDYFISETIRKPIIEDLIDTIDFLSEEKRLEVILDIITDLTDTYNDHTNDKYKHICIYFR